MTCACTILSFFSVRSRLYNIGCTIKLAPLSMPLHLKYLNDYQPYVQLQYYTNYNTTLPFKVTTAPDVPALHTAPHSVM